MTATEQLIAKQVSDVFPASVDDLPLADAARRGLIAPLRSLRVPPAAAIHSVPIVGGDFEERALAAVLDHTALNQAAASLYRDRFDDTPGIVYAAGVDHAYNLAQEFRAAGLKAEAVSGRTPPVRLAETLAAYERGEINVLINAMLLAEGWNSPRATVVMHLAPTASRRVYQQRIGRIMRMHPRKEAGIVVDFVNKGCDAQRARRLAAQPARRGLLPRGSARHAGSAPAAEPPRAPQAFARAVARPGHAGRAPPAGGHPARVAANRPALPRRGRAALLGLDRGPAGAVRGAFRVRQEADRGQGQQGLPRAVPDDRGGREPEPAAAHDGARRPRLDDRRAGRLRRSRHPRHAGAALGEGPRSQGSRILLRAIGEGKADAPEQILARWTWKLARATRKAQDRKVSAEFPEAKRLLGALANSRGHRHEENAAKLVERSARAAHRGRRRATRLCRRLHAEVEPADRRRARGIGRAGRRRLCARGEPAAAEGADQPASPPKAQEEGQGPGGRGNSSPSKPRPTEPRRTGRRRPSAAGGASRGRRSRPPVTVRPAPAACRRGVTPC